MNGLYPTCESTAFVRPFLVQRGDVAKRQILSDTRSGFFASMVKALTVLEGFHSAERRMAKCFYRQRSGIAAHGRASKGLWW